MLSTSRVLFTGLIKSLIMCNGPLAILDHYKKEECYVHWSSCSSSQLFQENATEQSSLEKEDQWHRLMS